MSGILVALSGGLDSTTVLTSAVSLKKDKSIDKLGVAMFRYGSKHEEKEIAAAKRVIEYFKPYIDEVYEVELDMENMFKKSALFKSSKDEIPEEEYNEENIKQTSVPFRNGVILSILTGFADVNGYNQVGIGVHQAFNEKATYPDCVPDFIRKFSEATQVGTFNNISIYAPFAGLYKNDVVKMGLLLGAPYHLTYSCYKGGDKQCGVCATCRDRIEAFKINKVIDPVPYEIDIDWSDCKPFEEVVNVRNS